MGDKSKEKICKEEQCAHFIEQGKLQFYRSKFVWLVIILSVVCAGVLAWLVYHHDSQMCTIVKQHEEYIQSQKETLNEIKVNKGVAQVNENIIRSVEMETKTVENMLQLQTTHQHAQFTLLSVWAGVLMIVFLIFSLYSMFKTDELIKQARDSINTIGNSKKEVDEKIQEADVKISEAVEHIKAEASKYLEDIKKDLEKEQSKVSENIKLKSDEFSKTFTEHVKQLEEAQKTLDGIFSGIATIVSAVRNTGTSTTETLPSQNQGKKTKK